MYTVLYCMLSGMVSRKEQQFAWPYSKLFIYKYDYSQARDAERWAGA